MQTESTPRSPVTSVQTVPESGVELAPRDVVSGLSLIVSAVALWPRIRLWFKPKRLEVAVHGRIYVTHQVGNPNARLHVSVTNTGGRDLQVSGLTLKVARDGKPLATLPAQNYRNPRDKELLLFVPFTLKAGEQWSSEVHFLEYFDRQTEKQHRRNMQALTADIHRKIAALPEDAKKQLVSAEPELVEPFIARFNRLFIWEPAEYVVELGIETKPDAAAYARRYRFILFDSDTDELKKVTGGYKFGAGIYWTGDAPTGISVQLEEHR